MRDFLACGVAVIAVSASAPTLAADQASLRLNWLVSGFHSMFYLGKERGCYADQGIDLTIGEGQGSGRAVQIVAAGSDTFGLADGPSVILGKSRGADVVAVMGAMVSSPYSISIRADRGVKTVKDLEGKTIAMTIGEASVPLLEAVWKVNGIDKANVTMLNVDGPGKLVAVLQERADGLLAGIENQVVTLKHRGLEQTVLPFSEMGVNTMGLVLFAKAETVKDNPDLVRRFVNGTVCAIAAGLKDPAASVDVATRLKPDIDRALFTDQLAAAQGLVFSKNDPAKRIGFMPPQDWESTLNLVKEYQGIETDLPAADFYSNEFLPK